MICHGNNFRWKYQTDANYIQFDEKAIKAWCDAWTKASTDEKYWKMLSKTGEGDAKIPPPRTRSRTTSDGTYGVG